MITELQLLELLEGVTRDYLRNLEINSLHYAESNAEVNAYLRVLNNEELNNKYKYLDINNAKKLLIDIKRYKKEYEE